MQALSSISSGAALSPTLIAAEGIADLPDADAVGMAKQFESLFVSMLIKEMRQSSGFGEGLFPGDASDTYGGMFDMFMGQHLAENGGIGLAEMVGRAVKAS